MNANLMSDSDLIKSYRNGDVKCFDALLNRHKNKIFSYIYMVVRDRNVADDLFQDTMFKIVRTIKSGSYSEEGKFIQFALRIAHNLTIDHFRKASKFPIVETKKENYSIVDNLMFTDKSPEQKMIEEQIVSDMKSLIMLLPDEQREVLQMRLYAEMSFKEIAESTNVSINTALGRMRYAVINLRRMIEEKKLTMTV